MPSNASYYSYRRTEKRVPEGPFICKVCDPQIIFASHDALKKHKTAERAKNPAKHIHCKYCFEDFITPEAEVHHLQLHHPKPQNLTCPGCNEGPFIRIADLARHIERSECPKIDMEGLLKVRDEKAKFAQDLIDLTNAPLKNHFTDFMPTTRKTVTDQYGWDDVHDLPAPTVVDDEKLDEEFPHLGEVKSEIESIAASEKASTTTAPVSRIPPHLRRPGDSSSAASTTDSVGPSQYPKPDEKSQTTVPAWSTKKNLFPDAPAAQQPSQDQLKAATTANPNYATWLDVDNPSHPEFSVGRYFCPYTNQFMCPKVRCGKAFKNDGGLVRHLKGPAHADKHYTCPYCHKEFHSLQAVAAHSESASQRCHIRYTEGYRAYLDQLTSGIVDVQAKSHDDGTHKYETTVAAVKRWGSEEKAVQLVEEARKKMEAENAEKEQAEEAGNKAAAFQAGLDARNAASKKNMDEESKNGSSWW